MKKLAFLLIVTFLILACAMTQSYDQRLQNWIGKSENNLLSSWGTPTGQKILENGDKVITYVKQETWYVPTEYYYDTPGWGATEFVYDPFFGEYDLSPYSQIVDTEVQGICQTSFYIQNGMITAYKWRGSGC